MSNTYNPLQKSYFFLTNAEREEREFTLKELCDATGWKPATATTYVSKKWDKFLSKAQDKYRVEGLLGYSLEQYERLMSQKNALSSDPLRPPLDPEVERLVAKAREAAINALDGYNRPGTIFRTESYIVMMVVAWTSLFHAIFLKRGTNPIYLNELGQPIMIDGEEKAWELSNCAKEYFGGSANPVRSNLDFIIGLRNKIEHRFVPAIDPHVAGECQALVLNFDELLVSEFGDYYALRESLSVPLQTSSVRSGQQLEAMRKFQGRQYDELKDYIDSFRETLSDTIYQDPKYSFRVYLIPKIGNHENSSDIAFEFVKYDSNNPDDMEALKKQVVLIRERQVPVANAGTYMPAQVAKLVAQKTKRQFSTHHHTLAWKKYKVRQSGETPDGCDVKYCQFDPPHHDYIYTQAWVDFLVSKMSDEKEYQALLAYRE